MVTLQSSGNYDGIVFSQNASFAKADQLGQGKPLLPSPTSSDMLMRLKSLAIDQCIPKASRNSIKKLLSQAINLRKALIVLRSDGILAFEGNAANWHSDEPANGSNLVVKRTHMVDSDESVHGSDSLTSRKKHRKEMVFLKCEYQSKAAIPIGPRFQADVPEWTGLANQAKLDSESLKWLGTRIWPTEGRSTETIVKGISERRSGTCSCISQESLECIKCHILDARFHLHSNLSPGFSKGNVMRRRRCCKVFTERTKN